MTPKLPINPLPSMQLLYLFCTSGRNLGTSGYSPLNMVSKQLVSRGNIGEFSIWDDTGTGASQDCTLWSIRPKDVNSGINAGTFYSERAKSNNRPHDPEVYCFRRDAVLIKKDNLAKDRLFADEFLNPGDKLISSNGIFRLEYQKDGNLVVYKYDSLLWASGTNGKPIGQTRFQNDGNLVIYDRNDYPIWSINKYGTEYKEGKLIMQDDGNLVAYDRNGTSYWSSGTKQ
ncbi:MAG: hypothetical protein HC903_01155 [Methylacidiphilales bacterium]|nr:hypothetical protein [Candidatus Methylacidiphilales bacterium]NJR15050.1 hypothetical protein [Calothrix sp. CSU_2_0]